jgi:hypothetical protein
VDSLLTAIRAGRRTEWLTERFGERYPNDLSDGEVIADVLLSVLSERVLSITECGRCGRVWIQRKPQTNEYWSFAPDDPGPHAVLDPEMDS